MEPLPHSPVIVVIPARNEERRIDQCLLALAAQHVQPDAVLLLANNCTDATADRALALAGRLPFRLLLERHSFPPAQLSAGHARRLAMQRAVALVEHAAVLLATDADAVVPPDWVERNHATLAAGADLVCGRVVLDPQEAASIPPHLHADDALERELTTLLDLIAHQLDPEPADPWPRHTEASGASLAVTAAVFRRVGGIPALPSGEDRAFVQALARIDARIRHDPDIVVTVSGRTEGRAPGGMADTIRRRMRQQDEFTDATVEPAIDAYRRCDFRRRARVAWRALHAHRLPSSALAVELGIGERALLCMLSSRHFGCAWAAIEAESPFLARRRVRFTELPRQIAYARQLLGSSEVEPAAPVGD